MSKDSCYMAKEQGINTCESCWAVSACSKMEKNMITLNWRKRNEMP